MGLGGIINGQSYMSKETENTTWPCHLDVAKKFKGRGINSEVWQSGKFALKIYKTVDDPGFFVDKEKLLFYQETTNRASKLAKIEGWTVRLPFPYGLQNVEVNPFPELRKCDKCGEWEGRVPFVHGYNLQNSPLSIFFSGWGSSLGGLNYLVERRLDVGGIFISPVNVKKISSTTLIVTDLCDDIASLEKIK